MAHVLRTVTVTHSKGLHARPAMEFTSLAMGFVSVVTVGRPDGGETVDAKSMMAMLTLVVTPGTVLQIEAAGDDAEEAVTTLIAFLAGLGDDAAAR